MFKLGRFDFIERIIKPRYFAYYLLVPFFSIWVIFYLYPTIWAVWMSFFDYDFAGSSFVGFQNYIAILSFDSNFAEAIANTGIIMIMVVPIQIAIALIFAVILDSGYTKFRNIIRAGYIVPLVASTVVLSALFVLFLDSNGVVNQILEPIFGVRYNWLSDPFLAKVSVAITHGWKTTGLFFIIFLAGLQNIPEHLYRAARVDGANRWQRFRYITIPQLRPITLLVTFLATFRAVQMFAVPFVLTNGGPGYSSTTVVLLLYQVAFESVEFGRAAAIAVLFSLIVGALYIGQFKLWGGRND